MHRLINNSLRGHKPYGFDVTFSRLIFSKLKSNFNYFNFRYDENEIVNLPIENDYQEVNTGKQLPNTSSSQFKIPKKQTQTDLNQNVLRHRTNVSKN